MAAKRRLWRMNDEYGSLWCVRVLLVNHTASSACVRVLTDWVGKFWITNETCRSKCTHVSVLYGFMLIEFQTVSIISLMFHV